MKFEDRLEYRRYVIILVSGKVNELEESMIVRHNKGANPCGVCSPGCKGKPVSPI